MSEKEQVTEENICI